MQQGPSRPGDATWCLTPGPGMASSEMDIAVIAGMRGEAACLGWTSPRACPGTPVAALCFRPAGVVAAVAFVLVCLLLLMLHYLYRHKGTYHTNEAKGTEFAESADVALQDDPALRDNGGGSRKEYFI
ncbi:hypothetical protein FD755_008189 [Muntiacus reevesi]|uniref:Neurexin/syndecan/glycophorin C domain-containing protein n=1 Tax=Muntiacus reevesi TaxID=9886 RepID=A0A5J5MIZ5_MUNRE|nr:hypothetical protein FD755_008189 [Muntiacus reevesi]